jgi:putative ABC transport system ATP-binding protein
MEISMESERYIAPMEVQAGDKRCVLQAHDLYRFYHTAEEETLALRGVSLHVEPGEIVAVMGPSGSGKSTLLSCLAGLDEPDGGYVTLMGTRMTRRPEAERAAMRAAHIGILLQSGNLFDHLTVEQNMLVQMRLAGKIDRRRVEGLLDLLGIGKLGRAFLVQLSGGEAARAGLAVALSASPRVLLADEPTGEVDAATEEHILSIFEARRKTGDVTLVATHSAALASRADRVIRLVDGRVVEDE